MSQSQPETTSNDIFRRKISTLQVQTSVLDKIANETVTSPNSSITWNKSTNPFSGPSKSLKFGKLNSTKSSILTTMSETIHSPKKAIFLRIQPTVIDEKMEKIDKEKKNGKGATTLSMRLRSEAANAHRKSPNIMKIFYPSIDQDTYKTLFGNTNPSVSTPVIPQVSKMTSTTTYGGGSNHNSNGNSNYSIKKVTNKYKTVEKQSQSIVRLSGLPNTMANELLDYDIYPDRSRMTYPSSLCVKCSAQHASLCIECGESQMDEAINLYRISRAQGSMKFFENALVLAGQKSNTLFIVFSLWKNYTHLLTRLRRRAFVLTYEKYRKQYLIARFHEWKEFVRVKKAVSVLIDLKSCQAKVVHMEENLQRMNDTKISDDLEIERLKAMILMKDRIIAKYNMNNNNNSNGNSNNKNNS